MGCVIAQGDLRTLRLDAALRASLQSLASLDLPALRARMVCAAQQCAKLMHLSAPDEQRYLLHTGDALCFRLHAALRHGASQNIFYKCIYRPIFAIPFFTRSVYNMERSFL